MRHLLITLLGCIALSAGVQAQIVAVHFESAKAAKKYKKHLVEFRGEQVVIGEPKSGIVYNKDSNKISFKTGSINELFIVDPKKPEVFAYYLKGKEKVESSKKNVISISGPYIDKVSLVMRDQTLPGLTREYLIRTEQIDEFRAARNSLDNKTRDWQVAHYRLMTSLERLHGWLLSIGFPGALKEVEKEIKKESKLLRDEALRARGEAAQASVETCDVSEELQELAQEVSGGKHVFKAYRSQHLVIHYIVEGGSPTQEYISDSRIKAAMVLGEQVIEGFRAEFIDPYLAEDYPDNIPDEVFHEFLYLPRDIASYEKYTSEYYGVSWEREREKRLKMKGGRNIGGSPVRHHDFWKTDEVDVDGIMCHSLGHSLAALHYASGSAHIEQDWLIEALGNQLSYEHLGRNNVTCKSLGKLPTYEKREAQKAGEKTVAVGRRAVYNKMALEQGGLMTQIALKSLFELADPDLAKGWSFYDYISRKEGKPGQMWLQAAGEYSRRRSSFIELWREAAATILGVDPSSAFTDLEDRWRKYAESSQDVSEVGKGKGR